MAYSLHYYDVALFVIGASLALGAAIGLLTPVAVGLSLPLTSLVALAVIGHALFVNGPVDDVEDLAEEVDPETVPGGAVLAPVVE